MASNSTHVLLVEDSDEDYITIKRAFKQSGVVNPLIRVRTGMEALDYLHNTGVFSDSLNVVPVLILLDLNLPGLDGKEVLKTLKSDPFFKKIPVVIMTTSNDERDVERCYQYGANSYIQKPLHFTKFVDAISRMGDYWFEISILPKVVTLELS